MTMRSTLCALAIIAVCGQSVALADEPVKGQEYTIKQSSPSVGTFVKRDIVIAGYIPLDKKYAELTPEQKNILKSNYENMGAKDEPPFPEAGLMPAYKALGTAHENADLKFKGQLTMYVQVDSEGKAKSVSVEKTPDPGIAKDMGIFLMLQKYKPALCNGTPCAQVFPFEARLTGPETAQIISGNPAANNGLSSMHQIGGDK